MDKYKSKSEKLVGAAIEECRFQVLFDKLELMEELMDNNLDTIGEKLETIDKKLKEIAAQNFKNYLQ